MTWIPVSEPPPLLEDDFYLLKSEPVLVYTSYDTMLVATLEMLDEDDFPAWYSGCSEHWNLHDTVKFWMPLPNTPKDQP